MTVVLINGVLVEGTLIQDMPDIGAITDSSSVVGYKAGAGRFSGVAIWNYVQGYVTTAINAAISTATSSWTSAIALSRMGTTTNDNATAGQIGEFVTASGASGAPSGSAGSFANIGLTPGDWEITGSAAWQASGGAVMNAIFVAVGPTINSISGGTNVLQVTFPANGIGGLWVGPWRLSINATTTVYLSEQVNFTGGGSVAVTGTISARRMR